MVKKHTYIEPLADVELLACDSMLCDSAGATTEQFDGAIDYEW